MAKTNWVIDPDHTEISFKVKHLMITNVKGIFKEFKGTVLTGEDDFITSDIEFFMNSNSVDTGSADRDTHLKSADFFEVDKYPVISFKGTGLEKGEDPSIYTLTGDLKMKEITRTVKLNVEFNGSMKDPWGNQKAGYSVTGKINRKDWSLNWNKALEAGGVLVSDEVNISCDVQLRRQL